MGLPRIDLVIVNYNSKAFLSDLFESLRGLDYPAGNLRLFFMDNGSRDGSAEFGAEAALPFHKETILNGRNLGFAAANNLAFARCSAEYIALLNPDIVPAPDWLRRMAGALEACPGAGMASSRQVPEESPRRIDADTGYTSWCSGGQCLIRKSALERTGGFEEKFFLYGEDVDLSWRMWLEGYACLYVPEAVCRHHDGRPEGFSRRRIYYHVRNSILLRYCWGEAKDVRRQIIHRLRQAGSLILKRRRVAEGTAVASAVFGHLFWVPYFSSRGGKLRGHPNYSKAREWVSV